VELVQRLSILAPLGPRLRRKPLERTELRRALRNALLSLRPAYREVFHDAKMLRNLSIAETAEVLEISQALVQDPLLRARLSWRDALAPGIDGAWSVCDGSLEESEALVTWLSWRSVCLEVWREVSELTSTTTWIPELCRRMEEHFKGCEHCAAVLDGLGCPPLVGDGRGV